MQDHFIAPSEMPLNDVIESFSNVGCDEEGYLSPDSIDQQSVARDLIKQMDNSSMNKFIVLYKDA